MPPLLQSAQLKPDVTITSADSDNDIEDSDDDRSANFVDFHSIIHVKGISLLNILHQDGGLANECLLSTALSF